MSRNTLILPTWMEPALVEGDFSKITVEKANMISLLKDYIAQNHVGFCVDMLSDRRFYSRPPIDAVISYGETLPGDFSTFVFVSNF